MPRLDPITELANVPAGGEADFAAITGSRGRMNAPQSMLMYAPPIASRASALNDAMRGSLSNHDYELAVLVAAREFPIEFVWSAHVRLAEKVGISDNLLEVIRGGGPIGDTPARDAAIVQLGRELIGSRTVSDATFATARQALGERTLIEVLATMGYYLMIGCVLIATKMEPLPHEARLPNLPA